MSKNGELIIKDNRALFRGEASTGLAIKNAPALADAVLDKESNAIKEDSAFVPMGDRVLARRIDAAVKTVAGIHLPGTGKTPAAFGVVVGVGQGRYNIAGQFIPLRVQLGAVVMFGKYAGTDIEVFGVGAEDGKCVILREEEIFGVIMSKEDYDRIRSAKPDPDIVGVSK